jgi:hypothetical protein
MPEIYENIEEFGKVLASVMKSSYKLFSESHTADMDSYMFKDMDAKRKFDMFVYNSTYDKGYHSLRLTILENTHEIDTHMFEFHDFALMLQTSLVVLHTSNEVWGSTFVGSLEVRGLDLVIDVDKKNKRIFMRFIG